MNESSLSRIKGRLVIAICGVLVVLGVTAFKWSIVDETTPFGWAQVAGPTWALFAISAAVGLSCLWSFRELRWLAALPAAVSLLGLLLVLVVPFSRLWLSANFALHRKAREEIVTRVQSGTLRPAGGGDSGVIALDDSYVVVEQHAGRKYILFYTFRGVLDHWAGFLYVPDGGDPREYADLGEGGRTEVAAWGGPWYFVSHQ